MNVMKKCDICKKNDMTQKEIINFYGDMALWCGLFSQELNAFFQESIPDSYGIECLYASVFENIVANYISGCKYDLKTGACVTDEFQDSRVSRYQDFFLNHLFEEQDFLQKEQKSSGRETIEWSNYLNAKSIYRYELINTLCNEIEPFELIGYLNKYIDLDTKIVLSFCGENRSQRLLFNTLLTLIFNAISSNNDPDKQANYWKLINDNLLGIIGKEYPNSLELFSIFKQLGPGICQSFYRGIGLEISDYDQLLSYVGINNIDKAIDVIHALRSQKKLIESSRLIEFFCVFYKAQTQSKCLDWYRHIFIKDNKLKAINALLISKMQDLQLISQGMLDWLISKIIPDFDIEKVGIPPKKKVTGDDGNQKPNRHDYDRYLPFSAKNVDKEKLINLLIDHRWVAAPEGCDDDELRIRLNYFFDNGEKVKQKPNDIDGFTIRWRESPKGPLLNLLINLLYNGKPEFEVNAKTVLLRPEPGFGELKCLSFIPGINSALFDNLNDLKTPVWRIVKDVFGFNARDAKIREGKEETILANLDMMERLANDFFSCRKKKEQIGVIVETRNSNKILSD